MNTPFSSVASSCSTDVHVHLQHAHPNVFLSSPVSVNENSDTFSCFEFRENVFFFCCNYFSQIISR